MIGFIKKDIALIKNNFKLLGILIVIYAAMGFLGEMDISFIFTFMSVAIMISTFSYDATNRWDEYSISLPDGKRNSVKSKYIVTIVMILITTLITIIISCITSYTNTKVIDFKQITISTLSIIFSTSLVLSFMYPVIYKFGVEKARISIFITVFIVAIIFSLISNFLDLSTLTKMVSFIENYLIIILIVSSILMVLISYKISERIFIKKEF